MTVQQPAKVLLQDAGFSSQSLRPQSRQPTASAPGQLRTGRQGSACAVAAADSQRSGRHCAAGLATRQATAVPSAATGAWTMVGGQCKTAVIRAALQSGHVWALSVWTPDMAAGMAAHASSN